MKDLKHTKKCHIRHFGLNSIVILNLLLKIEPYIPDYSFLLFEYNELQGKFILCERNTSVIELFDAWAVQDKLNTIYKNFEVLA